MMEKVISKLLGLEISRLEDCSGLNTAKEIIENELVKSGETFKNGNIIYVNAEAWYVGGAGIKAASIIVEDVEKALKL